MAAFRIFLPGGWPGGWVGGDIGCAAGDRSPTPDGGTVGGKRDATVSAAGEVAAVGIGAAAGVGAVASMLALIAGSALTAPSPLETVAKSERPVSTVVGTGAVGIGVVGIGVVGIGPGVCDVPPGERLNASGT